MDRLYEHNRAARSRASMAFSAAVEPMLINDSKVPKMRETNTAFRGMLQRG